MAKKKIILLAGPTASGKSKLAIKLAKVLNGEIINADSMQIYKEIKILSSRPSISDQKKVKHHLYATKSVKYQFSLGSWLQHTKKKISGCFKRKKIPILVGGTGLYFKAITDGLAVIPNISTKHRSKIRNLQKEIGQIKFYNRLIKIDPMSKKKINIHDVQRSLRAYEVKHYTDTSLFNWVKKTKRPFKDEIFVKIFLNAPKSILHARINKRVENMFREGAVSEVQQLMKLNFNERISSNKLIGVEDIKLYINKIISLDKAKERIKVKTRQYAKRQFTWSRGHMKSWNKIFSENNDVLFKKVLSIAS